MNASSRKREPISTGSEWTFDLIRQYDKEIARIAERYALDTYPNQIEVITAEQTKALPLNGREYSALALLTTGVRLSALNTGGLTPREGPGQPLRRLRSLAQQQHAGSVAVQPVNQARSLQPLAPGRKQAIDMPAGLGAPLHRQAMRLVQGDHHVVLVQDQRLGVGHVLFGQGMRIASLPRGVVRDRRNAHGGPGGQPRFGLDPSAVDADLAAASHLLHLDVGKMRPAPTEPAIQADAVLVLGDVEGLDFALRRGGRVVHRTAPNARRASVRPTNSAAIATTTDRPT